MAPMGVAAVRCLHGEVERPGNAARGPVRGGRPNVQGRARDHCQVDAIGVQITEF